MSMHKLGIAALLAFGAAACSNNADDSNIIVDDSVNAAEAADADVEVLPPSEGNGGAPSADNASASPLTPPPPATPANAIPATYHGRWGMNANDCDPGRSDDKGLVTISDTTMTFYESRAALLEQRPAIARSFSGNFRFTGEGQTWESIETLTRTGDSLTRANKDVVVRYRRCA